MSHRKKHNSSYIESGDTKLSYAELLRKFDRTDLYDPSDIDFIGYKITKDLIKEKFDNFLSSDGIDFLLITGPRGVGKTTLIKKLAETYVAESIKNNGHNPRLHYYHLESSLVTIEKQFDLIAFFREVTANAPSIVFIDKIDEICMEKKLDKQDRVTFNLLINKLKNLVATSPKILLIAATNRPEVLDPDITEEGFFSEVVQINLPNQEDRLEILTHLTSKAEKSKLTTKDLEQIAQSSTGYSYRLLCKLFKLAQKYCVRNCDGYLNLESFRWALAECKSSLAKSVTTPCPPLHWDDIGGVDNVKLELQRSVIAPLQMREKFLEYGIVPRRGTILYGPPGCSKTMLAQALATESNYNFISVNGPELFSKWVGDSEAAIRRLYRNAREIAPCIIFFDEIDGLVPKRSESSNSNVGDKVVTQLLTELNGIQPLEKVFTIAATNRPDKIDRALMRRGRLAPMIYIPLPDEKDRREIFRVHTKRMKLQLGDSIIEKLAKQTEGYSGAEIADVCQVAGEIALFESIGSMKSSEIEWRHFEESLRKVEPQTQEEDLKVHEQFRKRCREATVAQAIKSRRRGLENYCCIS